MPEKKVLKSSSISEAKKAKSPVVKSAGTRKMSAKTKGSEITQPKTEVIKKTPKTEPIKEENFALPREIVEDPNISPIFDVFLYRELFMALREKMDALYEKREKSEKSYADYDEAVYNIIANALTDAGAQDFLSYCYKKGKYDFCLMNYEKYMKWSLLAAASGNAFSISKLQIFLTNAVDDVLSMENHSYMLDFLELETENYFTFIAKMLCEEMVKILEISPEGLIKLPETYQEQSEELLRTFDNAKLEAAKAVKTTLKTAIDQLILYVEKQIQMEKEKLSRNKDIIEKSAAVEEEIKEEEPTEKIEEAPKSVQKPKIKKFRY